MNSQIAPIPKPLMVRMEDRTVFRIKRTTGEPISTGCYDAHCFSDPDPTVEYMSYSDWIILRQQQRRLE